MEQIKFLYEQVGNVKLTLEQYVSLLSQEFYFASVTSINLRIAAKNCPFPNIADYLRHHAKDEDGHNIWAMQDLLELGHSVPLPPTKATEALLRHMSVVSNGDESYKFLGLSMIVENLAPKIDINMLLPENIGEAKRFVERHTKVDVLHSKEINELIASLDIPLQKGIEGAAMEFIILYADFLSQAVGIDYDRKHLQKS
jgi:hypothetical protein